MNVKDEAIALRDRICESAPQAVLDAVDGNKWLAAMQCAEAYFKLKNEDEEVNRGIITKLYSEGRSVLYIALYCDTSIKTVVKELDKAGYEATEDPICSLPYLADMMSRPDKWSVLVDVFPQLKKVNQISPRLHVSAKPDVKEIEVIEKLVKIVDRRNLPLYVNRPEGQVQFILVNQVCVAAPKDVVVSMYKDGRSTKYIADYHKMPLRFVESVLQEYDLPYVDGFDYSNIFNMQQLADYHPTAPSVAISSAQRDIIKEQLVKAGLYGVTPEPKEEVDAREKELTDMYKMQNISPELIGIITWRPLPTGR